MKKQLLLAAAAVTALVAAGSAQAASVSYRAGAAGALADAAATPYILARDLNYTTGLSSPAGTFDFVIVANTATPPGTYTVQLDFNANANPATNTTISTPLSTDPVFAYAGPGVVGAVPNQNVGAAGIGFVEHEVTAAGAASPSLVLTQQTASSATYTLHVPFGNTVKAVGISPALLVKGPLTVTYAIRNQVGNAFYEPAVIQSLIQVSNEPTFASRVNGRITGADAVTFGSGGGLDTRIDDGASVTNLPFNTLTNPGQVGQVDVAVAGDPKYDVILSRATASTPVKRDLTGTNVTMADVTGAAITVAGSLSGLTFSGVGAAALTPAAATGAASVTLSGAPSLVAANSAYTVSVAASSAAATAPQLAPTDLPVSAQLTLASIFATQPAFTGSFETIQTDGLSYVIPWVTSNAFGQITGTTSTIRVSNISADFGSRGGRIYGQLYNPTNIAGVTSTSRSFNFGTLGGLRQTDSELLTNPGVATPIAPGVPAGGPGWVSGIPQQQTPAEIVISSVELQNAFGDFGRGDLRLTITDGSDTADNDNLQANPQSILVKRVLRSANGSVSEMSVVASGAGVVPVDQVAPY